MLNGINHITLSVGHLERSFDFYVSVLDMKPEVKWATGAYLSAGSLWFCISLGEALPAKDYSHICFDIAPAAFESYRGKLLLAGVKTWQNNRSEGNSLYLLDPDGHQLEIHVGSLESRLEQLKVAPYDDLKWY